MAFIPDDSEPLVLAQEDQTGIVVVVTLEPEVPGNLVAITSWSALPAFPAQFSVEVVDATLTLTIPNFVDVFPIQELRYLLAGVPGVVYRWADLPPAAEDVISYKPDPTNFRQFALTVNGTDNGDSVSIVYSIDVFANYSLGRDLLVAAVDARR